MTGTLPSMSEAALRLWRIRNTVEGAASKALAQFDSGNNGLGAHGFARELELSEHTAHLQSDWGIVGMWLMKVADEEGRQRFHEAMYKVAGLELDPQQTA